MFNHLLLALFLEKRLGINECTADFARCFQVLLEELVRRFVRLDEQIASDALTEAILGHWAKPELYDASKGIPLDRYFLLVARRNVKDLLRSERRLKQREREAGRQKMEADVALDPAAANILQEDRERIEEELWQLIEAAQSIQDNVILVAQLSGFRETAVFARILGITQLPLAEQRKEVKRHKDRIRRYLARKGLHVEWLSYAIEA